jgi:hypothetical protein
MICISSLAIFLGYVGLPQGMSANEFGTSNKNGSKSGVQYYFPGKRTAGTWWKEALEDQFLGACLTWIIMVNLRGLIFTSFFGLDFALFSRLCGLRYSLRFPQVNSLSYGTMAHFVR